MRFSLATLVLLVLWIGALMAVWARREPWVFEHMSAGKSTAGAGYAEAPDGVRCAQYYFATEETFVTLTDNIDYHLSSNFERVDGQVQLPVRFVDNDTLELLRENEGSNMIATYHRRFPEWWWGHFYRPEVWVAIALSGVQIWRLIKSRRAKA